MPVEPGLQASILYLFNIYSSTCKLLTLDHSTFLPGPDSHSHESIKTNQVQTSIFEIPLGSWKGFTLEIYVWKNSLGGVWGGGGNQEHMVDNTGNPSPLLFPFKTKDGKISTQPHT